MTLSLLYYILNGMGRKLFHGILLLWGFFVLYRVIVNAQNFTPFDWLDLCIHELGHIICTPFGLFIGILGGSAAQIIAPLLSAGLFLKQKDQFACFFCFSWLAESLQNLHFYVADAEVQRLSLVGLFGGEPIHDWFFLLSRMHLLSYAVVLGDFVRFFALLSVLFFLIQGIRNLAR